MNKPDDSLEGTIGRKAARREHARHQEKHTIWFGFGMFGLVGWAVAIPTLAGIAIGQWLDGRFAGPPSWTVTGLATGVILGCLNAWWWVGRVGHQDERKGGD